MVKQINIILDDKDHVKLLEIKGKMKWRDFIMQLTGDPSSLKDGGAVSDLDKRLESDENIEREELR